MEDRNMRHVITRIAVGVIWIVAGIVALTRGNVMGMVTGLLMGIAFTASGLSMRKKASKENK